jgi:hypothetical protein
MWMPGETSKKVFGVFIPKVVEQQEWIELGSLPESKRPTQFYACAFNCWLCCNDALDGSY